MKRKPRVRLALLAAVLALSVSATATFAVVTHSYTSTLSLTSTWYEGAMRTYSGNQIHIQLTTTSSVNGTYQISVLHEECNIFFCWGTTVGGPGNCPYNGFCGLVWNINLDGRYAFYFTKPNDGKNISSNSVQMWSTAP